MASHTFPLIPSSAGQTLTRPAGGEAAAGPVPSQVLAARLIATPFGLEAHGGGARLSVFTGQGVRTVRIELHGRAVDVECDDDARDALVSLLTKAPRP